MSQEFFANGDIFDNQTLAFYYLLVMYIALNQYLDSMYGARK